MLLYHIESYYNEIRCCIIGVKLLLSAPVAVRAWAVDHSSISIHTPQGEAGEGGLHNPPNLELIGKTSLFSSNILVTGIWWKSYNISDC